MCSIESTAHGGTITITGTVTQDTADLGTTAVANPSLNNILDGDAYSVVLNFPGAISSPGMSSLTSILFTDPAAGASESAFISGSVTIAQMSGEDVFSGLGCMIDPSTCLQGNELDLNFQIPASGLTQSGVVAQGVPGIIPSMDLLEDGGSTDIQGTVTGYSQTAPETATVPEPSTIVFSLLGGAFLLGSDLRRKFFHHTKGNL
jgi:hypothetical protein